MIRPHLGIIESKMSPVQIIEDNTKPIGRRYDSFFSDPELLTSRILIVDDMYTNLRMLEQILERTGFRHIQICSNPRTALPLFHSFQPDILLVDLHMPFMNGLDVIRAIREELASSVYFPVLMLTGDLCSDVKREALACGASDFLLKPFDAIEVVLRIRNLLQTRSLHKQIAQQNQNLEKVVDSRTFDLERSRFEVLERLVRAAEFRDDNTGQHTLRVGKNAATLAGLIGVPESEVKLIERTAPLHDIGKVGIPDSILLKNGKLTHDEYAIMQTHTHIGSQILSDGESSLIQMAEEIAISHHEHWDGSGYPNQLQGEAIPLAGRIVSLVDVFDALIHARPYKQAWGVPDAMQWIAARRGTFFEPRIVDAFVTGVQDNRFILV